MRGYADQGRNVDGEGGKLRPEQVPPIPVGHKLVEQKFEFRRVPGVLSKPIATTLVKRVASGGIFLRGRSRRPSRIQLTGEDSAVMPLRPLV